MRTVSIGQIFVLLTFLFMLFGDIKALKKQTRYVLKQIKNYTNK